MRNILSSLVLVSSLVACGGSESSSETEECSYELHYSAWGACQPDGTQSRTLLARNEATPGCSAAIPAQLSQPCVYVAPVATCPGQAPNICKVSSTLTMCCPSAAAYYCPALNICQIDAHQAVSQCGSGPTDVVVCTL